MKKLGKAFLVLICILCAIWDLIEVLLLPALFLLLGLWQQMPWQYYAITIGGYFGLLILLEIALHLIFKWVGKKYSSRFVQKAEKILARFSRDDENSPNPPTEHN